MLSGQQVLQPEPGGLVPFGHPEDREPRPDHALGQGPIHPCQALAFLDEKAVERTLTTLVRLEQRDIDQHLGGELLVQHLHLSPRSNLLDGPVQIRPAARLRRFAQYAADTCPDRAILSQNLGPCHGRPLMSWSRQSHARRSGRRRGGGKPHGWPPCAPSAPATDGSGSAKRVSARQPTGAPACACLSASALPLANREYAPHSRAALPRTASLRHHS